MPESFHAAALGGIIVVALAALAVGWNQIDDFLKRRAGTDQNRTIGPQPFEVRATAEYVHKRDFDSAMQKNTERHAQLFHDIGQVKDAARTELKADTADIYEKINKVDKEVGGLATAMDLQNAQLARIETTLIQILRKS